MISIRHFLVLTLYVCASIYLLIDGAKLRLILSGDSVLTFTLPVDRGNFKLSELRNMLYDKKCFIVFSKYSSDSILASCFYESKSADIAEILIDYKASLEEARRKVYLAKRIQWGDAVSSITAIGADDIYLLDHSDLMELRDQAFRLLDVIDFADLNNSKE
jgi:hypothetical protein